MNEADSKWFEAMKNSFGTGNHEAVIRLITLVEAQQAEIDVLTFKVSNLTTERDVANQEIERLKDEIDEIYKDKAGASR